MPILVFGRDVARHSISVPNLLRCRQQKNALIGEGW
jgi:hypothetical protein